MRKISKEKRAYWRLLSIKRHEHRLKGLKKKHLRLREKDPAISKFLVIQAPVTFSIAESKNRQSVLDFLSRLRRRALVEQKPIRVDFRLTKKMVSCGTLLFLAELDRIRRCVPSVQIKCTMPRDQIVSQVLKQVGILKLFGRHGKMDESGFDGTVKHWQFATGVCADASDFDDVLGEFDGKITYKLSSSIFKGVTEAMTNSAHHAYEEQRFDGANIKDEKRWWMFSQERNGELSVAFCDLGIGIPRSLPREDDIAPGWLSRLWSYIGGHPAHQREAAMIKAAIEIGRTRTNKPNRGLGLAQIVEIVDQSERGQVTIHSNSGSYFRRPSGKAKEILAQYDTSIMGTLIQWSVPIDMNTECHGA